MLRLQLDPKLTLEPISLLARLRQLFVQTAIVTRQIQAPPVMLRLSSAGQSFTANTEAVVAFATAGYDTHGWWASDKYTPLESGYYYVAAFVHFSSSPDASNKIYLSLKVNGGAYAKVWATQQEAAKPTSLNVGRVIYFNGSTDYLEVAAYSESTQSLSSAAAENQVSAHFIGGDALE